MHHADLSLLDNSLDLMPPAQAVGWLEPGEDYSKGDVTPEFVRKLAELLVNPWQPAISMGNHFCGFCRLTGGPTRVCIDGHEVSIGIYNLWLPSEEALYVAPSTILHYIDAHEYSPPAAFVQAVIDSPPMRSMAYLKAIASCRKRMKNTPID